MGEKERLGNYEEGTKTVKEITKSLGQTYYKLDEEKIPYIRADIHLIAKGKETEKEKETVSPEVNAARNINVGEEERHEEVLDKYWEDLTKKVSPEEQKKKQEDNKQNY